MKFRFSNVAMLATALAATASVNAQIFITEMADPNDDSSARYVELYNAGGTAVDLAAGNYALRRYTNGNTAPTTVLNLTGSIPAGGFYLASNDAAGFLAAYGFSPDIDGGSGGPVDSNGDDNIEFGIVTGGNPLAGDFTVIDTYGVPGTDGTGEPHEFEDGRAERVATVTGPAVTWDALEWDVDNDSGGGSGAIDTTTPAPVGFDPGAWIGAGSVMPPSSVSAVFGDIYTSTSTSIVVDYLVFSTDGGEGTAGNYSLDDTSGATVTAVDTTNSPTLILTLDTAASGDLVTDTLGFDNGTDDATTGTLYSGIVDAATIRAAVTGDADFNPSFPGGLVTYTGELIEGTLDDDDTATLDGLTIVDFSSGLLVGTDLSGIGAEITYVGVLTDFNGLQQIDGNGSVGIIADDGDTVLDAVPTNLGDITAVTTNTLELNESTLVTFTNVEFVDGGTAVGGGSSNYAIVGTTAGDIQVRIDGDVSAEFTGNELQSGSGVGNLPNGAGELTGVLGQFDSSDPRDSGYQLFPLTASDFNYPAFSSVENWSVLEK